MVVVMAVQTVELTAVPVKVDSSTIGVAETHIYLTRHRVVRNYSCEYMQVTYLYEK